MVATSTRFMAAGTGGRFLANPTNLKVAEPINSRAEDYKSPGENASPAGETIPAGIGVSSYAAKIVWFGGFTVIGGKVAASFAMLFKDCIFADSFSLVKMFADEQLIISNTTPLRQSGQKIRFYDGSQTAVDPLLTTKLGAASASAWPGYVYAVFEDFDCTPYGNRVPLIRAVLAGSVTEIPAAEERSTLTFGAVDPGYSTNWLAVDRTRNHAYVFYWAGDDDGYISVIDIATNAEISRAAIQTTNYSLLEYMVALDGTDYLVATGFETSGDQYYDILLINAYTGEVRARKEALLDGATPFEAIPHTAVMIESGAATRFLLLTQSIFSGTATGSFLGALLVDVTNGTLDWVVHPYENGLAGEGEPYSIAVGSVEEGVVTVWFTGHTGGGLGDYTVRKALISATGAASELVFSDAVGLVDYHGVAVDTTDDRVVVYLPDGTFKKLDENGDTVYTSAATETDLMVNFKGSYLSFFYSSRPGYVIASDSTGGGDVYQIDLSDGSATLLLSKSGYSDEGIFGYFDQLTGTYVEESYAEPGCVNRITLGDATPDVVDLVDLFTQLYGERGVEASDLVFTGFPGNETRGLKLENDTTTDNLIQSIAELYDVKIVESDGKIKLTYPPRDGSFAVDVTLDPEDFVEVGPQTIEKTIGAGEDEFAGCSVSYFDVDADYEKLEQEYNRPVGVYDVTRSKKKRTINTVLSLTASQAKKLATTAVFRSVLGNETYSFGLVPGMSHVEPGDIVQFDFRGLTVVARIKEASLNANYTQDCLAYQYLQYEDATYTGASLTVPDEETGSLYTRLIYLDLPLLSYSHDLGGTGLRQYAQMAGYGSGTISGTLYKSPEGSVFTSQGSRFGIAPVTGIVTAISGTAADPSVVDATNTITVLVSSGDIGDIAAGDRAAIGRPGRWCVVTFDDVSASGGHVTLSDILWGYDNGSEVWRDQIEVGDQFVRIDAAHYTRFRNDVTALDDTLFYKAANPAVPLGSVVTEAYVASGVAETPYAPVNLFAAVDGSDIDLTWDYRSRLASGLNPSNHGESTLSFEIDIMDGVTVKRTLTATTNAKTYLDADITTDFGSIPEFLTFRVYMMSALVGRGYAGEKTIQVDTAGSPMGLLLMLTYP